MTAVLSPDCCRIPNCLGVVKYRGKRLCMKHYLRIWKYGTVELPARPSLADRLTAQTERTDGCWLWTGSVGDHGYGHIGRVYVHRLAYKLSPRLPGPGPVRLALVRRTELRQPVPLVRRFAPGQHRRRKEQRQSGERSPDWPVLAVGRTVTLPDPLSGSCAAGKCGACVGDGWDAHRDEIAPCPCACHRTSLAVLAAREAEMHAGDCCDREDMVA